MSNYDHTKIENNWRDKWYEDNIYKAIDFDSRPKKYILAELPYPSGKFLHVGHMMRYTVPEIYSRFLRMQGYNVLFPMGWDCFGLPAETFAIKEETTPQKVISQATKDFKKAMQGMGFSIDWSREINTSDPTYYKWTQWMFLELYKAGLAELKEMPVWWCDELGVLADEEVLPAKDGVGKVSERGGYPVERKMFKQWVLKITKYADRLLEGLEKVDYSSSVKQGQINWIGKKDGANITYQLDNSKESITCFTTRPDTNFGATFVVLAPEHEIVKKILNNEIEVPDRENTLKGIKEYVDLTCSKSELERITENKEKTGVFTGLYVTNKLNNKKLPVWISDFVLLHFGTGAVVGVPGHDIRDFQFAKKFGLEIVRVIENPNDKNNSKEIIEEKDVYEEEGITVNSDFLNGLPTQEATKEVIAHIEKEKFGQKISNYKLRDQIFSRQRYWGEPIPLIYKTGPQTQETLDQYKKMENVEEVDQDKLPIELPIMKDFLPSKDGTSPLARNSEWNQTTDKNDNPAIRETDTMPTWAGSNWYYIRYVDPNNSETFADVEKMKYWLPVDKYFGDAGHTTAHLMYSRFWFKALYDLGHIPMEEPYQWRMSGGMLLGPDGRKMSKSKGNTVDPKDVMENYGADAARIYLAFIGPYEDTYPWNDNGIKACYRLTKTIYELRKSVEQESLDNLENTQKEANLDLTKTLHRTIKNITQMMTDLKMNTAVSEIMILTNALKSHVNNGNFIEKETWESFVLLTAPFAPFLAEELWQELNNYKEWNKENSVHLQKWPQYDENLAKKDVLEIPVQVNGKVRATLSVSADITEDELCKLALQQENVIKTMQGKDVKKKIYIPGKILNLVV